MAIVARIDAVPELSWDAARTCVDWDMDEPDMRVFELPCLGGHEGDLEGVRCGDVALDLLRLETHNRQFGAVDNWRVW